MNKRELATSMSWRLLADDGEFMADLEARIQHWKQGKPIPSEHFKVGAFSIAKPAMSRAISELQDMSKPAELTYNKASQSWHADGALTPFLRAFAETWGTQMMEFTATHANSTLERVITHIILGPYELHHDNTWHRDLATRPGGRTYVSTLFGPTTEYALGSYTNEQFYDELLQEPDAIPETAHATHNDIFLHDRTFTVHQSPAEEHEGTPRFFGTTSLQ